MAGRRALHPSGPSQPPCHTLRRRRLLVEFHGSRIRRIARPRAVKPREIVERSDASPSPLSGHYVSSDRAAQVVDEARDLIRIGGPFNPVAEVEDMAATIPCGLENDVDLGA